MAFPDTPKTLIQRLAAANAEADWQQFLTDYWGPVCRFAANRASISAADAEDVASLTFQALLTNRLLARWVLNRSAKLRTLLCSVVRNILSNLARVQQGRQRILRELSAQEGVFQTLDAPVDQVDAFYASWVADIVEQAVQSLLDEYHAAGKGDYFRVLHGRICEDMSMPEIGAALDIPLTSVENFYKAARKRLAALLEQLVRAHVARYCPPSEQDHEWQQEWNRLGNYLEAHGGLEETLRRTSGDEFTAAGRQRKAANIADTLSRIRQSTGGSPAPEA